jgi:hypothetical protein
MKSVISAGGSTGVLCASLSAIIFFFLEKRVYYTVTDTIELSVNAYSDSY